MQRRALVMRGRSSDQRKVSHGRRDRDAMRALVELEAKSGLYEMLGRASNGGKPVVTLPLQPLACKSCRKARHDAATQATN